ncbi:hypothetical protein AAVH_12118 [Aphelenchoides avenae]|nr:hypothetical protein AAVH_12118 [Aphelenchus avenae]
MRRSNFSTTIYDSFVDTLGTYLFMELDLFGFCRHFAETQGPIANFTERRQGVVRLVQGIAEQLLHGKKVLEKEGAGKSKDWAELARQVGQAGIDAVANGRDLPYPSPVVAVEKYQKVGEAIIQSIYWTGFNRETYRYEIVVYQPGSDPEEVCLMNNNSDVAHGNYKNVNYLISRVEAEFTSTLSTRIVQDNATIQALFR